MRLVCPSCQAAYEVPDDVVGDGSRRMRCARCHEEWTAAAAMVAPQLAVSQTAVSQSATVPEPSARAAEAAMAPGRPAGVPTSAVRSLTADRREFEDAVTANPSGAVPNSTAGTLVAERGLQSGEAMGQPNGDVQWPPIATATSERQLRETALATRPPVAISVLAWALTVVTICIVVGGAYFWREEIMRAWPPSERLYAAVGLH